MSHIIVTRTDNIQKESQDSYLKGGWEEKPAKETEKECWARWEEHHGGWISEGGELLVQEH